MRSLFLKTIVPLLLHIHGFRDSPFTILDNLLKLGPSPNLSHSDCEIQTDLKAWWEFLTLEFRSCVTSMCFFGGVW